MTEIELYGTKLIEAMQDRNPVLMLRRIRNNASSAVALACANSLLSEAAILHTKITTVKPIITSATESKRVERVLSYMCLQKLAELYKHTHVYRTGILTEACTVTGTLDKLSIAKLMSLSKFVKESVEPLLCAYLRADKRANKQHILREMLTILDKVQ